MFAITDIGRTAPLLGPTAASASKPYSLSDVINDPSLIDIPFEHVTLREARKGTNGKLIIHIQDAHANYSGQKSLAKALGFYMDAYGVQTVLTEGGDRDVTLDPLKKFLNQKDWLIVANKMLLENLITGSEYLNLTSEHPMKLMGIEYTDLYEKNLVAYAEMATHREDLVQYLHKIKISVERIKGKIDRKSVV
jgi:hypothetical protein